MNKPRFLFLNYDVIKDCFAVEFNNICLNYNLITDIQRLKKGTIRIKEKQMTFDNIYQIETNDKIFYVLSNDIIELREFFLRRKEGLTDALTSYLLWFTALKQGWTEKVKESEEMLLADLINTWGEGSRIEPIYDELAVVIIGPNGESITLREPDLKDI